MNVKYTVITYDKVSDTFSISEDDDNASEDNKSLSPKATAPSSVSLFVSTPAIDAFVISQSSVVTNLPSFSPPKIKTLWGKPVPAPSRVSKRAVEKSSKLKADEAYALELAQQEAASRVTSPGPGAKVFAGRYSPVISPLKSSYDTSLMEDDVVSINDVSLGGGRRRGRGDNAYTRT